MSFPNSDVFKDVVRVFSVQTKKLLTFKTNDRKRVEVVCITSEGCPFRIWASVNGKVSPTFYIKTINMEHKCSELTGKNYHCNAPFIAKGYIYSFMVDKNWSREGIQAAVQRDYGMTPGY
ncbi:putative transposase, MuDR, plant [Rosa chinensis]|uniref:Putative transposase, MuDR, plant n=1 Tax=Rosa chinensis TaxID=74649 RepID=A0A2P6RCT0_ROSCH|nr:putative transposase, MuDR, plant [Rosa chinensis]